MKGNTINEFIGDLLSMGGPEKEFIFRSKKYFLETTFNNKENIKELVIFECCDKANPYIGENNKLEFVDEDKLEFICDIGKVKEVVKELRKVHPYEEPAIDIVPLIDVDFSSLFIVIVPVSLILSLT